MFSMTSISFRCGSAEFGVALPGETTIAEVYGKVAMALISRGLISCSRSPDDVLEANLFELQGSGGMFRSAPVLDRTDAVGTVSSMGLTHETYIGVKLLKKHGVDDRVYNLSSR
jgi:hypothetical protein